MRRFRDQIDVDELSRALPAFGVLVLWAVLMFQSGGFWTSTWLPAGLLLVALLVLAWIGSGRLLPPPGNARSALLTLIAFTVFCFASVLWSDTPGKTWEAANLLLVGVLGAWVLALAPWRTRSATLFMVAFSWCAVAACLVALVTALDAVELTSRFVDSRFSPPLDYPNATAAFGFMAAMPALLLAARPDASVPAKALAQGVATFLCAYALLPQSRGAILGGIAAVVVLAISVPFRWRLALHALLVAVALVAVAGPVGDVYAAAAAGGHASPALRDAFTAVLIAGFVGGLAGIGLALAEQRIEIDDHRARLARLAGIAAAVLVALTVIGVGVAKSSSIADTVSDQWQSLTHPGSRYGGDRANDTGSRLTSVDPLERYDYWRVSLDDFGSNPLLGIGAGGFEHSYELDRRYPKPSRYPHNLVMKVLGDTGLAGLALMAAYLFFVGRGLLARTDRLPLRVRAVGATAAALLAYFLAHGLFDWLEAYPVLVGPALGFPLLALAVREHAERERRRAAQPELPAATGRPRWAAGLAGAGAVFAFLALLGPWLAERYRERASDTWRTDSAVAYSDLRRAARLDPFSAGPYVLQGVIATERGEWSIAQAGFRNALEREDTWLPHFGLGAIAAEAGDRATAEREIARSLALNARDEVLPEVAEQVLSQRGLAPSEAVRAALTNDYADQRDVN